MKTIYPEVEKGIVNRVTGSIFGYQGWPSVARDEKGTLYVVASGFRVSHICPFGKTVLYMSKNEGKTWSPPMVINDTYLDDRDGGILYMGNGRLLVTWFTHSADAYRTRWNDYIRSHGEPAALGAVAGMLEGYEHLPEEEKLAGSYIRISDDYGMTWGEKIYMPITAPHGPTTCMDGSLVYLGLKFYEDDRIRPVEQGKIEVSLYRSTDGGYTWKHCSDVRPPDWLKKGEQLDEPHVLELAPGKLLGVFRIEGRTPFTIGTAFSESGGKTWGEVTCTGVSGSPPHLMRHSSGALICTYGRRETPMGERAMVSYDDGVTWEEEYVLDDQAEGPGGDVGYPSTVELSDGSLMTVYYQRFPGDAKPSVLYAKWRLK